MKENALTPSYAVTLFMRAIMYSRLTHVGSKMFCQKVILKAHHVKYCKRAIHSPFLAQKSNLKPWFSGNLVFSVGFHWFSDFSPRLIQRFMEVTENQENARL
jgi:hypothetical protein